MNTNHIIFFTQLYYPDMTTTATIMTDLVEDLAAYGLDTTVVCAQPTYIKNSDPQITQINADLKKMKDQRTTYKIIDQQITPVRSPVPSAGATGRAGQAQITQIKIGGSADWRKSPSVECHNGVSIRRVWSFLFDKNKILGRILNGVSCFFSMLPTVFSTGKNDFLIFNTNPALLPFLGFIAAKLRGQRSAVLVHDLWPELPAHVGMIKEGGLLYRAIDVITTLSFKYAIGIIVLSEAMKRIILHKVPGIEDKIHVIHNWADAGRVYPVAKKDNQLLYELGLRHKKVVMYSGNLGRYQPIEVMIGAARELRDRDDIVFVFAGDGGKRQKAQEMAASQNLDNIIFIPFQPLDRLAESLSMADVALIGIYPENEGVIMPSKLYGLLAVGKPIICVSGPKSEVVEILNQAEAGVHSSIDDPKELAQKIVAILDDPEKAEKMGQNGRQYFLEHFDRKMLTREWEKLLKPI